MSIKVKEKKSNSTYNPALDQFENIDVFPSKTEAARKHLEGRDIRKEIEIARDKERITKP
jgi:hypothetical protein